MVAASNLDAASQELHFDALPIFAREAFERCALMPLFSRGGWYLADGTALALLVGHRQSQDLDFFTSAKSFDDRRIEQELAEEKTWSTESRDDRTIYGEMCGARMSLVSYPFFTSAEPFLRQGTISVMRSPDIAAMKVTAVSQRGRKRDFVDLYWLSRNVQPLSESIERMHRQYSVRQNPNHILKSLVNFGDAESDVMPTLFFAVSWEEIKAYFRREVPRIAKEIMGLA